MLRDERHVVRKTCEVLRKEGDLVSRLANFIDGECERATSTSLVSVPSPSFFGSASNQVRVGHKPAMLSCMGADQCDEKNRLLTEYRTAARQYSDAVSELTRKIGTSSKDEYLRLHQAVEAARLRADEVRIHLERHFVQHHCGESNPNHKVA